MSGKQERIRRAYSRKEREREEFQATQVAAETEADRSDLAVTDELLDEIDELLASTEAIDAASYLQKGGQ